MRRTFSVLSLGFFALVGSTYAQVFNNNYYFSPNALPNYSDITTVKATELVNESEIITVGYAREPLSNGKHDIVLVKTKASGTVLWAYKYGLDGLDERAYGLTVSYDGKHVIVAGTAERQPGINETVPDWDGLVMKIEISSGNVIWSARYGTFGQYQELRMVERTFDTPTTRRPTYMLVGSSSLPNLKSVLYAISVHENGVQQWGNIYLESTITRPNVNDFAYTMVKNPEKNFIVTGTRYKDQEPSKIFTIGINPVTGAMSDKYIDYNIEERNHFEGAICNIRLENDHYYGLAFTTQKPEVENGVDEAISVVILDKSREPLRTYLYWQEGHRLNNGLAIYQSDEDFRQLNVYTNTFRSAYNPGFLNINISGGINYFLKYNASENSNNKYPTAMVQTKYGYTAKALHRDGENGFLLAGLDRNGRTECAEEQRMMRTNREIKFRYLPYDPYTFGEPGKRDIKEEQVHGKMETCDGQNGQSFKNSGTADALPVESSSFRVYPNPLNGNQHELKLEYNIEESQRAEISIHNALGQQTYRQSVTLNSGSNQLPLEVTAFSPGVNLITVRNGSDVLYRTTVIRE